jgi:alkanesulfonate monooxygenase SsuD/methylene tetrahydromethanopterin reductase-like flavin-dependent oxidoreductase (luciferase family)
MFCQKERDVELVGQKMSMKSHISFKNRGKRAEEYIQILKKIWTEDVVE